MGSRPKDGQFTDLSQLSIAISQWRTLLNFKELIVDYIYFRYHVPRSWLHNTGNLLVVFEELGGDPTGISLVKRNVGSVCAHVNEWQPVMKNIDAYGRLELPQRSKARLMCAPGQKISSIKFASFGTPQGVCGSFQEGNCHAHKSYDAFEKVWPLSLSPSVSVCDCASRT